MMLYFKTYCFLGSTVIYIAFELSLKEENELS